jgi:release factor glutamine methyltransferase
MISIKDLLLQGRDILKQAGINSYLLDCRLLLEAAANLTHEQIIINPDQILAAPQQERFLEFITRRANREPVSHIIGKREFYGIEFIVTKDTLDPRPDSETIIEAALKNFPDRTTPLKILDLGTGSGCLLLTLLSLYPNATGLGVDISKAALDVAKANSAQLSLEARATFQLGDWGDGIEAKFDLIISNPPYIKNDDIESLEQEVKLYEPHSALAGGMDGLDCYRQIAPFIGNLLDNKGIAIFEIGQGQEQDISDILFEHKINTLSYARDLQGIIRCVIAGYEL